MNWKQSIITHVSAGKEMSHIIMIYVIMFGTNKSDC